MCVSACFAFAFSVEFICVVGGVHNFGLQIVRFVNVTSASLSFIQIVVFELGQSGDSKFGKPSNHRKRRENVRGGGILAYARNISIFQRI